MNGYAQITISGKKVGLKFAFPAVKWFTQEAATSDIFFTDDGSLTDYGLAKMIQCAYRNKCLLDEVQPSLKFADFADWIETCVDSEVAKSELTAVLTVYAESSISKKVIESSEEKKSLPQAEMTGASTSIS